MGWVFGIISSSEVTMFTGDNLSSCHLEELNIVQVKHEKGVGVGWVFGIMITS